MSKARFTLNALAVVCLTLLFTSLAQAQATRTWVSGVGDDVNPCSRTAPCKTFAGAISKTAAAGEINVIDPGGFGAINITKSMTIDGKGPMASILASLVTGVQINAGANDVVTLRNLSINGAGNGINGIRIGSAKHVVVNNVQIFGFRSTAANSGRGISDVRTTAGSTLLVIDTEISNNAKNGIAVLGPISATLKNVNVSNSTDAATAAIAADAGSKVTVIDCLVTNNLGIGYFAGTAGTEMNIESSVASSNLVGVQAGVGGIIRLSNMQIVQNGTGINIAGGTMNSFGTNKIVGNGVGNGPFPNGSGILGQ